MNDVIFFAFYNLAHRSVFFDKIAVFTADTLPYLVILAAGIFLLFHHEVFPSKNPFKIFVQKWKEIALVFFSGILAWFLASILKIMIHHPRPFVLFSQVTPLFTETDFSFPSGHATFYMALSFALFFSHKKVGYIFMFIALLIGIARIIVGIHFPLDILGGFVLGTLTAYAVRFVYGKVSE